VNKIRAELAELTQSEVRFEASKGNAARNARPPVLTPVNGSGQMASALKAIVPSRQRRVGPSDPGPCDLRIPLGA